MNSKNPDAGGHHAFAIFAALALGAICNIIPNTLPAFLLVLARARGLNEAQAGICATADNIGVAVGTMLIPIFPMFFERLNWRGTAILGLAAMIGANLLAAVARDYSSTLLALFVIGIGSGIALAIAYATLAEGNSARQMGLLIVAQLVLGSVSLRFFSPLVDKYGAAGLFEAFAATAIIGLALAMILPRMSLREAGTVAHQRPAQEKVSTAGWLAVISVFVLFAANTAVFAYLEYMGIAWGGKQVDVERAMSKILLAGIAGSLLAASIGLRFGYKAPLFIGYAALLSVMVLFPVLKPVAAFLAIGGMFFFFLSFVVVFQFSLVTRVDQTSGAAMLVSTATFFGSAAGSAAGGYLATPSYAQLNIVSIAAALASLALVLLAIHAHQRSLHP